MLSWSISTSQNGVTRLQNIACRKKLKSVFKDGKNVGWHIQRKPYQVQMCSQGSTFKICFLVWLPKLDIFPLSLYRIYTENAKIHLPDWQIWLPRAELYSANGHVELWISRCDLAKCPEILVRFRWPFWKRYPNCPWISLWVILRDIKDMSMQWTETVLSVGWDLDEMADILHTTC